ncbi:UPF0669 protein C6orf120 homolog [Tetranychus urticae]|uniref:Uncharacterized protein n=1 Tax=Tetranychus urticae TaxID=32264 RepID=T1JSW0_TETUR|nr:UPF0669 protein C6orf120 homolog [Tetranychus urticae]
MYFFTLLTLAYWTSNCYGYQIVSGKSLVYAGNYSYYMYKSTNRLRVILTTLKGDADLYIAKDRVKPTVDLESYQLQSVSCGIDIVDIPDNFGPDFTIGVYGHPSFDYSVYQLDIVSYTEGEDISAHENGSIDLTDKAEVNRLIQSIEEAAYNEENRKPDEEEEPESESEKETFFTSLLHYLLDFILIVIDLLS